MNRLISKINTAIKILKNYQNKISLFKRVIFKINKNKNIFFMVNMKNKTSWIVRTNSRDFNVINDIFVFKIYDKYFKKITNCNNIIDIGSNVGAFSVLCGLKYPNAKIYCYEPMKQSSEICRTNSLINNLIDRIFVYDLGVAGKPGMRKLTLYNGEHEKNSLYNIWNDKKNNTQDIKVITLAEIIKNNNIHSCDLVKMDCEGAEFEIMESLTKETLSKIRCFIIEYHFGDSDSMIKKLKDNGFNVEVESNADKTGMIFASRI